MLLTSAAMTDGQDSAVWGCTSIAEPARRRLSEISNGLVGARSLGQAEALCTVKVNVDCSWLGDTGQYENRNSGLTSARRFAMGFLGSTHTCGG